MLPNATPPVGPRFGLGTLLVALIAMLATMASPSRVAAQDTTAHPMPGMPGMKMPAPAKKPAVAGAAPAADTGAMMGMPGMQMIDGPLGIPMERTGSGTSWLPDDSPMHADHVMRGPWELMLHGVAFAMYDKQGSRRGDEQFSSVNWGMLMATRNAGGGRLQLRGMVSAEPWTVGGQGYPLLLQTGETYRGVPLHDRQHPHDLFMEVAALYEHAVSSRVGLSLYAAPVGEPAIGPVAYPHRPSAMNDPMAPISHHWQDATHISFGVLTGGIFTHSLRLEGSIFNGREPDENRTNFDYRGRSLDSYAGRVAWNPSEHWSASAGYAFLKSPESAAPDDAVHRISASIMNGRTFGEHGELATTFIFGANRHSDAAHLEPSYLLESNLEFGGAHSVFGRAEYVQKGADDLVLGAAGPTGEFNLTSLVAGYVYEFDRAGSVRTGIGARASVDIIPSALEPVYGTRTPGGFAIYVRFRPQRMSEGHGKRMGAPKHTGAHEGHASSPMPVTPAQVVEQFHASLAAGDTSATAALLDSNAVILESGDLETRAEYLAHHLAADIEFARAVHSVRQVRSVEQREGTAWVVSTSRSSGQFEGRTVDSDGAELVVLARSANGWRIVAIHWSSHRHRP